MIHRTIYCRGRYNPGSLLIRIGDGMGQWSHTAGILSSGEHVVEATALHGVTLTPLEDVIRRSSEFHIVDRAVPDKAAGDTWALSTVGCGYDWRGAVGVPWGRRWQDEGRWFCSEHAEVWQQQAGLHRFVRDTHRGIGPNISYRVA
jgi:uncharacterized protein YycO